MDSETDTERNGLQSRVLIYVLVKAPLQVYYGNY